MSLKEKIIRTRAAAHTRVLTVGVGLSIVVLMMSLASQLSVNSAQAERETEFKPLDTAREVLFEDVKIQDRRGEVAEKNAAGKDLSKTCCWANRDLDIDHGDPP